MATVTFGTYSLDTNSGTHVVNTSTTLGDLIVLIGVASGSNGISAITPTDNHSDGNGAYTLIQSSVKNGSTDQVAVYARNALIGSNSASVNFTHAQGTTSGGGLVLYKISGMSLTGSASARQSPKQDNQPGSSTPSPLASSNFIATNPVIGVMFNASNPAGITPRSGYSEGEDDGWFTPTTGIESIYISSGETATASSGLSWGSTSATGFGAIVVEFNAPFQISVTDSSAVSETSTVSPVLVAPSISESSVVSDSPSLVVLNNFQPSKIDSTVVTDSATITLPTIPTNLFVVLTDTGTNGFVPGIKIV